jgi:hypothetical protein
MTTPHIITAYTTNSHLGNYYQQATIRLTKSLIKHNLPHTVYVLPPVTDWTHGCSLKPKTILNHLQQTQQPTLWIDADAEILNPLELNITQDLALHITDSNHWLTGTLYIHPNAIPFIQQWVNNTKPNEPDEITLSNLYHNHPNPPTLQRLPIQYNAIIHAHTGPTNIKIGHHIRPDIAPTRNLTPTPP